MSTGNTIAVPEWVIHQSVRYALPRNSHAVNQTAEHLISIWPKPTPDTRTLILRDISEEHSLWARQAREHRSPVDETTWRDCLNKLLQIERELPQGNRANDQYAP